MKFSSESEYDAHRLKTSPWKPVEAPQSLQEGWSFVPAENEIERLKAELAAVTSERDALKVEYESRAEWISKMNSILGYDNSDGFHSEPSPEKLAAEAITDKHRMDKLVEYYQAIALILHSIGWTAPNDAQWFRLREMLKNFRQVIDNATNSNKP